nr:hypothetical protein OG690_30055 [Streptomyces tubercidicus]
MKASLLQRYRNSLLASDLVDHWSTEERADRSTHPLWRRYVASLLDIPLPVTVRNAHSDSRSDALVAGSRRSTESHKRDTELTPVGMRLTLLAPSPDAARRPRSTTTRVLASVFALCALLGAAAIASVVTLPYGSSTSRPPATVAPASPTGTDTPDGYRRVDDPAGFTLDIPEGWRRTERSSGVFYQSPGGNSLIQIFTVTDRQGTPYHSLKESDKSVMKIPGYARIRLEQLGSGDDAAAELEYTYNSEKYGSRRVLERLFIGIDGVRYAIVVADSAEERLRQRERQGIVLGSFCPTPYCGN